MLFVVQDINKTSKAVKQVSVFYRAISKTPRCYPDSKWHTLEINCFLLRAYISLFPQLVAIKGFTSVK